MLDAYICCIASTTVSSTIGTALQATCLPREWLQAAYPGSNDDMTNRLSHARSGLFWLCCCINPCSLDADEATANIPDDLPEETMEKLLDNDCLCPITREVIRVPVMLVHTGHVFENESLTRALQYKPHRDPLTNEHLSNCSVLPCPDTTRKINEIINPSLCKKFMPCCF